VHPVRSLATELVFKRAVISLSHVGAKLCMIADMLEGQGTVTGVDIAESRLGACRNVLAKYAIPNARLLLHDGTTVDVLAPSKATPATARPGGDQPTVPVRNGEPEGERVIGEKLAEQPPRRQHDESARGSKKRERAELVAARWRKKTKRKRVHPNELPNVFYAIPQELCLAAASVELYDKVMIDAQCTLDASVRHILKYGKLGWKDFTPDITQDTVELQVRYCGNLYYCSVARQSADCLAHASTRR
jgi:hypothetical protein